jgi:hypothetical protein
MDTEHFKTFSAEDFIIDKDFRMIIKNPFADRMLEEFIKSFPEKKQEILLAADILNELNTQAFTQSAERKKDLWQEILVATGSDALNQL